MRYTGLAAPILLAAYLPACTSYQVMADPSSGLLLSPKPIKQARITLRSGERFVLASPQVSGDSLRGLPNKSPAKSVGLADVTKVEVQKTSALKTTALVLGVAVVATGVALIYIASMGS